MGFSLVEGTSLESEVSEGSTVASGNVSASLPGVGGAPLSGEWFRGFPPSLSLPCTLEGTAWAGQEEGAWGWEAGLAQWFPDLWISKPSPSKLQQLL